MLFHVHIEFQPEHDLSPEEFEIVDSFPQDLKFPESQQQALMGRSTKNEIVLPQLVVSGQHARIYREEGGDGKFFLEDLGSRNGTLLGGKMLPKGGRKLLRPGDKIKIVDFELTFFSGVEALVQSSEGSTEAISLELMKQLGDYEGIEQRLPRLVVLSGEIELRQDFVFASMYSEYDMGRSPACEFHVPDVNMSRQHVKFYRDLGAVKMWDMGSRNGVLHNGERMLPNTEYELRDRDVLTVGTMRFQFDDPMAEYLREENEEPEELPSAEMKDPVKRDIPMPEVPHPLGDVPELPPPPGSATDAPQASSASVSEGSEGVTESEGIETVEQGDEDALSGQTMLDELPNPGLSLGQKFVVIGVGGIGALVILAILAAVFLMD
ncbi:MAG: FHA domain-containing protein [Myxococcota bacterium]